MDYSTLPLGRKVEYTENYDAKLLHPIARKLCRQQIGIEGNLPFNTGYDLWNCYEVSWRNAKGKPEVRILEFSLPASSEFIVESKSLKLYLNSLNGTIFASEDLVQKTIEDDLSNIFKTRINASLKPLEKFTGQQLTSFTGINLDSLDVEIKKIEEGKNSLKLSNENIVIEESLYSNLLTSKCLVTGQPDWASVQIQYKGKQIDHESLLKYIISFRNNNEFHEQCVERMFLNIMNICSPEELTIYARYTRRGGIDINPIRSTRDLNTTDNINLRHFRQ